MKSGFLSASAVVLTLLTISVSQAQSNSSPDSLEEVVVTGYRFLDLDTSGTTNLPLPIEEVPQAITLVNSDFIKAADLKSMVEVAQYTPGATYGGAHGNFSTRVKLRGFLATYAIDGLTVGNLNYEFDNSVVDRLEIVKGPASVVYGSASPGGVINLALKGASPDAESYVTALGGSWNRWRVEGQMAAPITESGDVRGLLLAAHEESDSFVHFADSDRTTLFGALEADFAEDLTAYAKVSYETYDRTGFEGTILNYPDGTLADLPRSFFIGNKDKDVLTDAERANAGLQWEPSPAWSFALNLYYQHVQSHGPVPSGYALEDPAFGVTNPGEFLIYYQNWRNFELEDANIGGYGIYKLDDWGLSDSFISTSIIYQDTKQTREYSFPGFPAGTTFNILDGEDVIAQNILTATFPGFIVLDAQNRKQLTISAQAVLKPVDFASILLGASHSDPNIEARTGTNPWADFTPDAQTSYRAALTFEPIGGLNVYASYSESFEPNLRIDINDNVLPPAAGEQYEVGAKYISPNRQLLLTAAVFDLRQTNQAVFDQIGADMVSRYRALGEVQHRGVEFEAVGKIADNWQINAGFSVLDPEIKVDPNPALIGKTRTHIPQETASLFITHDFGPDLYVAGGVRYVGAVETSYDNSWPEIPSYTLVDFVAGYTFDNWRLQVNVKNVTDEFYSTNPNELTALAGNTPGEPRSFTISMERGF